MQGRASIRSIRSTFIRLQRSRSRCEVVTRNHLIQLRVMKDDAQLCGSRREIRNRDKEGGSKLAKLVGKITGEDVAVRSFSALLESVPR